MSVKTKTQIIRIGNSQGIRIPKPLLEQSGISGDVELEVKDNQIVIHAAKEPRSGWDEMFSAIATQGDDKLRDSDIIESEWDTEEWEWEQQR